MECSRSREAGYEIRAIQYITVLGSQRVRIFEKFRNLSRNKFLHVKGHKRNKGFSLWILNTLVLFPPLFPIHKVGSQTTLAFP